MNPEELNQEAEVRKLRDDALEARDLMNTAKITEQAKEAKRLIQEIENQLKDDYGTA